MNFGDSLGPAVWLWPQTRRILAAVAILGAWSLPPAQAAPPPGYYLVWGDEFNGASLDTTKWDYWLVGPWRDAVNSTGAVSLNGSNVVITTYTSGGVHYTAMLASEHHFRPRYGYYEANIQWGDTNGMWSAFWLRSPTMGTYLDDAFVSGAEIDVAEHRYIGIYQTNIANIISCNIHWNGYGPAERGSGSPNVGTGLATNFHTYSLLWTPRAYLFGVDGATVWNGTSTTPPFGSGAYVLLSSEVDDSSTTWAGLIPAAGYGSLAASTVKMAIDYFRYYAPTNVLFWTGAVSADWTNAANWVAGLTPDTGSDLTFSYLSANPNSSLGRDYSVHGLVFLGTLNPTALHGSSTLTLGAGGIDMVAADHNVTLNVPVNVAAPQTWTIGRNNPGNVLAVNAALTGTATLTKAGYGTLVLSGSNSFSGSLNVDTGSSSTNDGVVTVTCSAAIASAASPLYLRNTGTGVSTLQLANGTTVSQAISVAGRNASVAALEAVSGSSNILEGDLILAGGGPYYGIQCDAGTFTLAGTISAGPTATGVRALTLQGKGNFVVSGSIQNGSAATLNLINACSGTLTLSGTNTYTGTTTHSRGVLVLNSSLTGALVVNGGVLSGTGTVAGDTAITGGQISPGSTPWNAIGTLCFGGNLTLGPRSVTCLELHAAAQTNDVLRVAGTLTGGGTLAVLNLAGPLVAGQSFKLFTVGTFAGNFSAFSLPALPRGLAWDTARLTNGILSVVAIPWPPTPPTAYAAAVCALQPVGYWPLQETGPGAPAAMEPNLGTLGALGNAYYANTNATAITPSVAGALAGDSDTAVAFNQNAQTFAFVPRASPALTLQPPFTLEAWFNPATAVYGVILGEGGGASLNGGPTYGGFQFGWAGGSQTRFESQLYKYGLNQYTVFDTPSGYALGAWYHYVLTYETSGRATMYVNGLPAATATMSYVADTWSPLTIGNGKWNGLTAQRAVNGTIDEVAVYTNLLAASAISNHYYFGTHSITASPYQQVVLKDQPLLYFRMNYAGVSASVPVTPPVALNLGSAPTDGAYQPGTVPGGTSGPPFAGLGAAPVAALGNGLVSCLDLGYDPTFNPTNTQPFSVLLWFRSHPADSSLQTLLGRGQNSWALNLDGTTGRLVWNSGAGSVTSSAIYNDGAWHQVAGVYDGTNNSLFVDGAPAGSRAATGTIPGNANHLFLGGDPDYTATGANERYFAGAIAQAALFRSALTLSQVQATYQAAIHPPLPSLALQRLGGSQIQLDWSYGTLQTASAVSGPFNDVPAATPPYLVATTNAEFYYRVRR